METFAIKPIARMESDLPDKFGLPRQAGVVEELEGRIVFEPAFRNPDATYGVVLYNANQRELRFNLTDGQNRYQQIVLPARSVVSVLINTDQAANRVKDVRQTAMASPDYYTLQGIRIDEPQQPGIYIHQGRKELKQ